MRSIAKASSAGSNQRQATGLGRVLRGAFTTRGASSSVNGSGAPSAKRLTPALGALAGALLILSLAATPASATKAHPFKEVFGSAEQPSFGATSKRGVAVDQSTGDLLILDTTGDDAIYRYNPDGTPSDFSALGTNVIDGKAGADATPQNGFVIPGGKESQIAVDNSGTATDGNIYVTHVPADKIQIFSSTGEYIGQLSQFSGGTNFGEPCGVTVDPAGNVYVGDFATSKVHKYAPAANPPANGDFVTSFTSTSQPCTLAAGAGPSAGFLFVNPWSSGNTRKVDATTGEFKYQVDTGSRTVSVDPGTGFLYSAKGSEVTEYDVTGAGAATTLSSTKPGSQVEGIAVRETTGDIYVSRTSTPTVDVFGSALQTFADVATDNASTISGTGATLNGTVNPDGVLLTECKFEYGTTTGYGEVVPCTESPGEIGAGTSPVAVHAEIDGLAPNTTHHFRLVAVNQEGNSSNGSNKNFKTLKPVITEPASAIGATTATLNGTVNPFGAAITDCEFEWGPTVAYGNSAPCDPDAAGIGTGTSPVAVEADLSGLQPGTVYHYRLTAANTAGPLAASDGQSFQTLGPVIVATWSEDVALTEALLKATIEPGGKVTTFHFEYGKTTAYGQQTPEVAVGSDNSDHVVSRLLEGLEPGTIYHYRVVATNPDAVSEGPDRTFSTFKLLTPGVDCPNQEFRIGASAHLPDCRAYEMVSPIEKNGGDIATAEQEAGEGSHLASAYRQASVDGNKITYSSSTAFGDTLGGHWSNQYLSSRGPDGWSTHAISSRRGNTIPMGQGFLRWSAYPFLQGFTPDLSTAWLRDDNIDPLTSDALQGYVNLYRRDNGADSYEALTTQGPFGPKALSNLSEEGFGNAGGPRVVGYSSDLRHQVFIANAALTPDADDGGPPGFFANGTKTQLYDRLAKPTDGLQRLTVRATAGNYTLSAEAVRAVGTLTTGSPNITDVEVSSTGRGFEVGDTVVGDGIPPGTTITAVGEGELTLSQNASFVFGRRAIVATETTSPLSATASAAEVQAALEGLGAIGAGNVVVSGGPGDASGSSPYEIAFAGELAGEPIFALKTAGGGLSGGSPLSSATVAVADPGGPIHLVSVLPSGQATPQNSFPGTATNGKLVTTREQMLKNAVSDDGSRIFWSASAGASGPGALYLRENAGEPQSTIESGECTEPAKACTIHIAGASGFFGDRAQFWAAAADGSQVLYSLGNHPNRTIHLFDVETRTSTQVAGQARGVAAAGEDLSHIYFLSGEDLASGAVAGENNLYDYHRGEYTLVYVVSGDDVTAASQQFGGSQGFGSNMGGILGNTFVSPIHNQTRVSPDGRYFAFMSNSRTLSEDVAGYDNTDIVTGKPDFEVYRYDATAEELSCVSCNPSGARPRGNLLRAPYSPLDLEFTNFPDRRAAASIPSHENDNYASRILSDDGERLFFHSDEALLPRDTNGVQDVYQWQAPGSGSCDVGDADYFAQNGGCISLISSGRDDAKSEFIDATPDGDEVYISVDESLDPRDPGLRDVYVAKTGGGFPLPNPTAPCEGEACQTPPPPPADPTPASAAFSGLGNPVESGPGCQGLARRAQRLAIRAKRQRRAAKRSQAPATSRKRRIGAKRSARRARALSKRAKRCRARSARRANTTRRAGR